MLNKLLLNNAKTLNLLDLIEKFHFSLSSEKQTQISGVEMMNCILFDLIFFSFFCLKFTNF